MRLQASSVLGVTNDGMFAVKQPVKIGGVILKNDIVFSRGVKIGGIDLSTLVDKVLEVEKMDGVYIVKGYYAAR